jgi:hypothetical protein
MGGEIHAPTILSLERTPIRIEQEAEWVPESVWMVLEKRKALSPLVYPVEINTK